MDRPELSPPLRQALVTVLGKRGVSPADIERIVDAVGASATPEVVAILEARHPERAAWVAPINGYLSLHTAGYLLSEEAKLISDYSPPKGGSRAEGPCAGRVMASINWGFATASSAGGPW